MDNYILCVHHIIYNISPIGWFTGVVSKITMPVFIYIVLYWTTTLHLLMIHKKHVAEHALPDNFETDVKPLC